MFIVPAVRTVLMLCVAGLARAWLIEWSAWQVLSVTALILLFFDPFVVWQAGFWLSFVAVGLLLSYDEKVAQSEGLLLAKDKFVGIVKLQAYLFLAMLPISLLLFGKVSWFGLAVNVVAVGLFGLVIVPLDSLAGVIYPVLPSVSDMIWQGLIGLLANVSSAFGVLATVSTNPYLAMPVGVGVVVLGFLAVACWQGKWLPKRFIVLPVVAMAMSLGAKTPTQANQVQIVILPNIGAVGQVVVQKGDESWLMLRANSPKLHNYDHYARQIKAGLDTLGVGRLTGIVVQTPDETLAKVAGQLSLEMSVQEFWWAGGTKSYGKLVARPCVADVKIGAVMTAMTGWRQIGDNKMHACAVWVNTDVPLTLLGDDEQNYPTTNVVVNAGNDDKLWQVWEMLCRDDKKPVNPVLVGDKNGQLTKLFGND